ncbi:MAG TPA: DUF4954 family protein [Chitinophagaceae bacterium]|nr:DUF4954 family protein [Chitinophagaceae bacterium]
MSEIKKRPIRTLGYDFVSEEFIPKGKDEYYLRNIQNRSGIHYRNLTTPEINLLVSNNNSADDWSKVLVTDPFHFELVKNCKFYGLVRIGKLEPVFLEFHDVRLPAGLYNSTIVSSDFGDNVVVNNVHYMSHYITGNEVILANVNEISASDHSKFGNGIIKAGEKEDVRIWLEVCNENAGRRILPFNGMLPGDAYLWSRYRADEILMKKFKLFTEKKFDKQRGYYGKIGDGTVIKNCGIIKDVWIGSEAYIKGANKLKNLTINSGPEGKSQIGEGCEMVNGIVGFGCRVFYGVKAVRFVLASHSQLKYGARLINSYLGNNSTISCCEVLNSLIFPAHEQHHNNSFLCAAVVMGQSNMAAGATIGSNHNSRSADGELIASRGFWPGLCVSLKHNSRFASFTIIAKGDFPAELNIPIPFSLVSNDVSNNRLLVIPAYWFMFNMYALARNEAKYKERDTRSYKTQFLEYDFLAPDSVNEIFDALYLLEKFTGKAYYKKTGKDVTEQEAVKMGKKLLEEKNPVTEELEILAEGFENSRRPVQILKTAQAYSVFKELVVYYGTNQLLHLCWRNKINSWERLQELLPAKVKRTEWKNIGGQLISTPDMNSFFKSIHSSKINSWEEVHDFYKLKSETYPDQKFRHAFTSLMEILNLNAPSFDRKVFQSLIRQCLKTRTWMVKGIRDSRAKDYSNPFRKMVYETKKEMEQVTGRLDDNSFIKSRQKEMKAYREKVLALSAKFK